MCFIPKARSVTNKREENSGQELGNAVGRVCVAWGHSGNLPACKSGTWEGLFFMHVGMLAMFHLTIRPPLPGSALAEKHNLCPISRLASYDSILMAKA